MNPMGHDVPTMIGVDHTGLAGRIVSLIPDYMVMGERGMADMTEMEMPLPDNTIPMMSGRGPFGSVEMGGMFSVVKVRRDQNAGDYSDPGWFAHPQGTIAYEHQGGMPDAPREHSAGGSAMHRVHDAVEDVEIRVRKPRHGGHE